jgi:hypothetical protein
MEKILWQQNDDESEDIRNRWAVYACDLCKIIINVHQAVFPAVSRFLQATP